MDGFRRWNFEVEDQQSHRYSEDAVAERGDALDVLTCNTVVERMHPKQFSIVVSAKAWGLSALTRRVTGEDNFEYMQGAR